MKNNVFSVSGGSSVIQVWCYKTKSLMECFVDSGDLKRLPDIAWYASPARFPAGKYYVMGKRWDATEKKTKTVMLHRVILDVKDPAVEVDHRDNNGLNNRRSNLRPCTHKQNLRFHKPAEYWAAKDHRLDLSVEYREERKIANAIAQEFGFTRAGMYKIRMDERTNSPAAIRYREAIAGKVRSLYRLHRAGMGMK